MKAFKQLLWTVLAAALLWVCHRLVLGVLVYPIGGGEFHAIFATSGGGRIDVALQVYVAYIVVMLGLAMLLILSHYPAHGLLIALAASAICCWSWWEICSYPHQTDAFHSGVVSLLPVIPLPMFYGAQWAMRRRQRIAELDGPATAAGFSSAQSEPTEGTGEAERK